MDGGARHLVLVGRHAPNARAATLIRELEGLGAQVLVRTADIGEKSAMEAILAEVRREMPPLRGVIHAAGALADGVLLQQQWTKWSNALRGKAQGARVLHELTRGVGLDFFVMFSAAGLLLGPAGQGAYAAANAELDALAYAQSCARVAGAQRRMGNVERSRHGGSGRGERGGCLGRERPWMDRAGRGFRAPRASDACWCHPRCRTSDRLEPLRRESAGGRGSGLFPCGTVSGPSVKSDAGVSAAAVSKVAQWRVAPESQRRSLVAAHVAEQALSVLGLGPETVLEPRAPLKDAGLDSLMAVELRNALTRSIGQSLPATLLFDYPSIDALATHLAGVLQLGPSTAASQAREVGEAADASASAVASLSDEEAEAELLAELNGSSRGTA